MSNSDDSKNENVEEPSQDLPHSSKLLSGSSLLQIHVSTGKSLPKDGVKDFTPSNSWMEKKQIQCALDERKELLGEERVDKWSCLAGAVWNPKKKLAEVTRRAGKHFQTLGFEKEGTLYLYPEEALYMLETNSLELDFGGVSVSIQQGYSLLLGPSTGCELNEYRTYSHLMRQGYRLLRFTKQIAHTKYERTIRLDQHAPVKRNHPGQVEKNEKSSSDKSTLTQTLKVENHEALNKAPSFDRELTPLTSENITSKARNISAAVSDFSEVEGKETSAVVKNQANELLHPTDDNNEDLVPLLMENNDSLGKMSENSSDSNKMEETIADTNHSTSGESRSEEQTPDKSAVDDETRVQDAEKLGNGDSCEQVQQPDAVLPENVSTDGLRTKAYDIAESLLSMGSALVGQKQKPTNDKDHTSSNETNTPEILTATLQSEIMKILGTQLDTGVSEEALAAVASTAASTILSHVSNQGNEEVTEETHNHENISESNKDSLGLDMDQPPKENSMSVAAHNRCKGSETTVHCPPSNVMPICQNIDSNDSDSVMVCPSHDDDGNENNACLQQHSTDSNDSGSIMVYSSNDNVETGKDNGSQCLKRPATSEENMVHDKPPILKRAKVIENDEEDIEILEYVPEKKQVELVDLSDESSDSDSLHGIKVDECDSNSIEVIDVGDSSSTSSSEFTSNETSNDSSVIFEDKTSSNQGFSLDVERRQILEIIPNMHNLTEITVKPPGSDLLPENVRPQRHLYHINRHRLVKDAKGTSINSSSNVPAQEVDFRNSNLSCSEPLPSSHVDQRPPFNYGHHGSMTQPQPQLLWPSQPGLPLNPVEAVQAIAQLVLPMLGLPANVPMFGLLPNAFPHEQSNRWIPNNGWFPRRPWGPRRPGSWHSGNRGMVQRYNQHPSRVNNFQRFRPRPYGNRRSARRPYRGGGSNRNWQHPPNIQIQTVPSPPNDFPLNEVVPFQSASHLHIEKTDKTQGPSSWKQMKTKGPKNQSRKRYFNPPKKYTYMHKLLDKNQSDDVVSDSTSENTNSPTIKPESDSGDEDRMSGNMEENEMNCSIEHTDESCSSPSEVKPLLSPRECTDFVSVFKSVQVIKEADTPSLVSTTYEHQLKPKFDLFSPSKPFKKGKPPVPDFHLCVMRANDVVPAPGDIRVLMEALDDSVPVMFAVVSPDAISFFKFFDVSLPSVTGDH